MFFNSTFLLIVILLSSIAQSTSLCLSGTYLISGNYYSNLSQQTVPYDGFLVVDTTGKVQRIIQIQIQGNNIQQLWEGTCSDKNTVIFKIRASNTLSKIEDYTLSNDGFQLQNIKLLLTGGNFEVSEIGLHDEIIQYKNSSVEKLFQPDQRKIIDATGNTTGLLIEIGLLAGINQVIEEYRKLPLLDPYRNRPEFKNKLQLKYEDYTDLEFYREHPDMLRIRNKSLSPLAITEAKMKRSAFSPKYFEKTLYKEAEMAKLNLNDKGILEIAHVNQLGQKIGFRYHNDSALWTAMYTWSQFLHYKKNGDLNAYIQFKKSTQGLVNLMRISSDPKKFARFIVYSPSSEKLTDGLLQGIGEFENYKYSGRSNNDMVKGLLMGYFLAYDGLKAEDQILRNQVAENVVKFTNIEAVEEKDGNLALAHGLKALWTGKEKYAKDFIDSATGLKAVVGRNLHIGSGFYLGGIEDASGIHLTTLSSSLQYMIAARLQVDPRFVALKDKLDVVRKAAKKSMLEMTERMDKAHHHYLNIMAYAITRNQDIRSKALQSTKILAEVPMIKIYESTEANLVLQPDWSRSAWPKKPWKYLDGFRDVNKKALQENAENIAQGVYSYPIYESIGYNSNYLWKDHQYQVVIKHNQGDVSFSSDYLILYWLAVSSGLIPLTQ